MEDWGSPLRLACLAAAMLLGAASAQAVEPVLSVSRAGPPEIDPGNHYAEVSRFQVRLLYPSDHPRAGQVMGDYMGLAHVEEWRTSIYDGRYGASHLPFAVLIENGRGSFALHSLARYTVIEKRSAPIPQVAVYLAGQLALVDVPQWVDSDNDDQIDWLEYQVEDIFAAARARAPGPVQKVLDAVEGWSQSWRRDCGGVMPDTPTIIRIGPACLNSEGENAHRLDMGRELTATILHEARHVWVYRNPGAVGLPRIFDTRRGSRARCDTDGYEHCIPDYAYRAGYVQDHENDAERFAQRYKGSF